MPFFKSHPDSATPGIVFTSHPEIYRLWSEMSQVLMNGPSPLSPGERETIAAFTVGVAGCDFAYIAHSEAAYAWGIARGLLDDLVKDVDGAAFNAKMKPLLRFVRKLTLTPGEMTQEDADAVFAAGWDEEALHDAIAICARMCFMQRIVEGHSFIPMSREHARENAANRIRLGYVNLYPQFREAKD